jgi:outer membrane immunogenic protein
MKRLLLAAAAVATLLSGSAGAADLGRPPPPAPVYVPPPVPVALFSWTGCYVGGNVGGLWDKNDWNDSVLGDFGSNTASGAVGGVQGGCNYQADAWVVGIQGDYDWTSAHSTNANQFIVFGVTDQTQLKSLASVTGRVGYSWNRFLAYVKGGGAWLQGSYTFQFNAIPVSTASASQTGWTVGVGGEYAFLHWLTGFIEYDYYNFKSGNPSGLICTTLACGFASNTIGVTGNVNVIKTGLNFKFGPGL